MTSIIREGRLDQRTASEIPQPNLNGHAGASLVAPRKIIAQPSDISRESGVDPAYGYEYAGVNETWQSTTGGRDDYDEANRDDAHGTEYERRTLPMAIRDPGE